MTPWRLNGKLGTTDVDLTAVYADQAESVNRRATFDLADGAVVIDDEIANPKGSVRWALVTKAMITITGRQVSLVQSGKRLVLTRRDDAGGLWEEYSLKPCSGEEQQNRGFHLLGFTVDPASQINLKVGWKIEPFTATE